MMGVAVNFGSQPQIDGEFECETGVYCNLYIQNSHLDWLSILDDLRTFAAQIPF